MFVSSNQMEYSHSKRNKRQKRRRRQIKKQTQIEVRFKKKQKFHKNYRHNCVYMPKEKLMNNTMNANAFWENYNAAHEWQKSHKTIWWKTKCFALEHENQVLKETIRNMMQNQNSNDTLPEASQVRQQYPEEKVINEEDNLEFYLDADMMGFLAKSMQHKIELKNQRENKVSDQENQDGALKVENMFERFKKRSEDAKLLYGKESTKILAMETALQTSINRHIDKAKPQYWPNIPLKL